MVSSVGSMWFVIKWSPPRRGGLGRPGELRVLVLRDTECPCCGFERSAAVSRYGQAIGAARAVAPTGSVGAQQDPQPLIQKPPRHGIQPQDLARIGGVCRIVDELQSRVDDEPVPAHALDRAAADLEVAFDMMRVTSHPVWIRSAGTRVPCQTYRLQPSTQRMAGPDPLCSRPRTVGTLGMQHGGQIAHHNEIPKRPPVARRPGVLDRPAAFPDLLIETEFDYVAQARGERERTTVRPLPQRLPP